MGRFFAITVQICRAPLALDECRPELFSYDKTGKHNRHPYT